MQMAALNRRIKEQELNTARLNARLTQARELSRDETVSARERLEALEEVRKQIFKNEQQEKALIEEKLRLQLAINAQTKNMFEDDVKVLELRKELFAIEQKAAENDIQSQRARLRLINEIKKEENERLEFLKQLENERLSEVEKATKIEILLLEAKLDNLSNMEIEAREKLESKLRKLKEQEVLDRMDIDLANEKLTAKDRELIVLEAQAKIRNIYKDNSEELIEIDKSFLENATDIYRELAETIQSTFQNITNELRKQDQIEAQTLDRRLDRQAKSLEFQQELAKRGIKNNLDDEKKALAEAEAERERFELRRQRRERRRTILQTYLKLIEKEDPIPALGKAVTIAAGLTGFYDGTDEVNDTNAVRYKKSGRDPFIAKLEKGEMILNPNESNFVRNNVGNRKDLINFINQHKNNTSTTSHNVVTKVQEVKLVADVDSIGQVIISLAERGKKTNTTFSKNHRI
jgi:hypothetical protein